MVEARGQAVWEACFGGGLSKLRCRWFRLQAQFAMNLGSYAQKVESGAAPPPERGGGAQGRFGPTVGGVEGRDPNRAARKPRGRGSSIRESASLARFGPRSSPWLVVCCVVVSRAAVAGTWVALLRNGEATGVLEPGCPVLDLR